MTTFPPTIEAMREWRAKHPDATLRDCLDALSVCRSCYGRGQHLNWQQTKIVRCEECRGTGHQAPPPT